MCEVDHGINSRLGAALGNAIAGYRDKDVLRATEGLGEVVAIVRELEARISALETGRRHGI